MISISTTMWIKFTIVLCLWRPLLCKPQTTTSPQERSGSSVPEEVLKGFVPVSRCRATCINKFLKEEPSTKKCQESPSCSRCWEQCHKMQDDPKEAEICRPQLILSDACNRGCQEACIHFKFTDDELYSAEPMKFPGRPYLREASTDSWVLSWSAPEPISIENDLPEFHSVFVLLYKTDPTHPYKYGGDTIDLFATVDGQLDTYPYLEFKVIAINQKGITDMVNFLFPDDMALQETSTMTSTQATSSASTPGSSTATISIPSTPSTTEAPESVAEVQVILVDDLLEGILTLTPPSDDVTSVLLSWVRVSCRTNHFLPACDLPSHRYEQEIQLVGKKQTITLKDLTYNSAYLLKVTSEEASHQPSEDVFFVTPSCPHPDTSFLRCLETPQAESMQNKGNPKMTSSSSTTVLVALSSAAVVVILVGVGYFCWNKFRPAPPSDSLYFCDRGNPGPVPVITVDGHNYVSLDHVPDIRIPQQNQKRRVYTSVPLLHGSGTASPRSLQMTSSIAPPASDSSSVA